MVHTIYAAAGSIAVVVFVVVLVVGGCVKESEKGD